MAAKAASNAELEATKVVSEADEAAASKKEEERKARAATLDPEKLAEAAVQASSACWLLDEGPNSQARARRYNQT